jgi:4-amino-4-deoxy-L-arabinose transferase-like glycosyltransferase
VTVQEALLISALLILVFARLWNARGAWIGPWVVLSEEGEALAWVDTVLRGRALSRDVFCLYGPLSTWAVALLFGVFGPSLGLWRTWIFALNAVALFATYLLLRQLLRTRAGSLAATAVIGLMCSPPIPGMSWSISRVGLGLAALACLTRSRADSQRAERWSLATGALLGVALLYSQEVGLACSAGVGAALLLTRQDRLRALLWTAAGAALVLLPCAAYLAANASFGATIDNLFLFPRVRLLGFDTFPFPEFAPTGESLRAYGIPVILAVSGFSTATKLLRGDRDARTLADVALFVFGALLFNSALSRPDDTHLLFAAPPAMILLAGLMEDGCFALSSRRHRVAASLGLVLGALALALWGNTAAVNLASLAAPAPAGLRPLALPRGGGALLPDAFAHDLEAVVSEIQSRTTTDEPFWVFPNEALLYFLADRPQPTRFPLAHFAVTSAQRLELIDQLERVRPHYTVLYRNAWPVDGIRYEVSLPEVLAYLNANYELDSNIGVFSILRRRR